MIENTDAEQIERLNSRVIELLRENAVLLDMLLSPNPDSEPDNARLHREKCDALTKLWAAQRDLHDARSQLVKVQAALSECLGQMGWTNYTDDELRREVELGNERAQRILRGRAALTDDHQSAVAVTPKRAYGALPPPGARHQIGSTANVDEELPTAPLTSVQRGETK